MKWCYSCFRQYDDRLEMCPYCGYVGSRESKNAIFLPPGTLLANRYVIGEGIGSGGFGFVYKAWDSKLETVVAVKEFFSSRLMNRAPGTKEVIVVSKMEEEYKYRKERFLAEARYMAKFSSHPNIINVFEFFQENGTAYIVMEYMNGIRLDEYLKQHDGKIDREFALYITNEVGKALTAMHKENIIHKDVAPDNIFICTGHETKVKLYDFGAAKLANAQEQVIDIIMKVGYSPKEQYVPNGNIGPWTDVYALGATLYVMLTGIKPTESTNRAQNDTVVPPMEYDPSVSENLSNAVMRAMAIDIPLRYKSVQEFLNAINGDRKVLSVQAEKKRRSVRRVSGIIIAALVLAVVGVLVAGLFKNRKSEDELKAAEITVWFCVKEGTSEEEAMKTVISDFENKYQGVKIDYKAIPEAEYETKLEDAAKSGNLPNLFESTGVSGDILKKAENLDEVLKSEQSKECLFLDQYDSYYSDKKQIPLGIEIPVAYVITSGAVDIEYADSYFSNLEQFGSLENVAFDGRYEEILRRNFGSEAYGSEKDFLNSESNTKAVLISSSMAVNDVRALPYAKKYVYYNADEVICKFTYEWSVGGGSKAQIAAAEKLLSWMLGNVYQQNLMVNTGGTNQVPEIPINKECFETKIKYLSNLSPIGEIYSKFVFKGR